MVWETLVWECGRLEGIVDDQGVLMTPGRRWQVLKVW